MWKPGEDNQEKKNKMNNKYPKEIFKFERGAFSSGMLIYTITEEEDCLSFNSRCCNEFVFMPEYSFKMPKDALEELIGAVSPVNEWMDTYRNPNILDGYGYTIKLDYGGIKLSKRGYAAYPFHSEKKYHEAVRKIQQEIENLCEKYAENYSPEGIEDRLGL